jgi:hypothetical protein
MKLALQDFAFLIWEFSGCAEQWQTKFRGFPPLQIFEYFWLFFALN